MSRTSFAASRIAIAFANAQEFVRHCEVGQQVPLVAVQNHAHPIAFADVPHTEARVRRPAAANNGARGRLLAGDPRRHPMRVAVDLRPPVRPGLATIYQALGAHLGRQAD